MLLSSMIEDESLLRYQACADSGVATATRCPVKSQVVFETSRRAAGMLLRDINRYLH